MPERGKNTLTYQNTNHKQMKVPYVIYADFEALLTKMDRCGRNKDENVSYTEKIEKHLACGFACTVVRSDGEFKQPVLYRGENAEEMFGITLYKKKKK